MQQKTRDLAGPRPMLIINHLAESDTGHVGRWLVSDGFPLDIRCPRFGDRLPETLDEHSGVVVFGGPMSANEPEQYVREEIDWLEVPLKENRPLFGICLGAQMLSIKLGARVGFHADGKIETGYYPISPTQAGAALIDWPERVYHWHREGFTLPDGAVQLAAGETFENQAYRYGEKAFGIQFHPEVSYQTINRWVARGAFRLVLPNARPLPGHINDHLIYRGEVQRWLDGFLKIWTTLEDRAKTTTL